MWVSTTSLFHYPPLLAQLDSLSKEKALLDANVISPSLRGGGVTPITDKIRKVVFDVAPQVVFKVKGGRPLPNWMFFYTSCKGGGSQTHVKMGTCLFLGGLNPCHDGLGYLSSEN